MNVENLGVCVRNNSVAVLNWYEFSQNNSGGRFHVNQRVCHRLFIEAVDADDATRIAESLGVYFHGVDDGIDCECCGDRWYYPNSVKFPLEYTKGTVFHNIEEYAQHLANAYGWTTPDVRIFYKNSIVKEIFKQETSVPTQ